MTITRTPSHNVLGLVENASKKGSAAERTIRKAAILISYPKKARQCNREAKGASEARTYKNKKYSFYQNTEDSFLFFRKVLEDNTG